MPGFGGCGGYCRAPWCHDFAVDGRSYLCRGHLRGAIAMAVTNLNHGWRLRPRRRQREG